MNVYRIEMKVAVTMYVRASSEAEARKLAVEFDVTEVELSGNNSLVPVSGRNCDDPELPDVSLSPVGTLYVGKMKTVELAEEGV